MVKQGPLFLVHSNGGVVFQNVNDWAVPATFSSPDRELEILKSSVGLVDMSGWGVLRLGGSDRLDFVHRMSTNDVLHLESGQGLPTAFLTPIGRMIDLAFVFVREDDLLLLVGRGADEVVDAWIRKHIFFNDDVHVENITSDVALMGLRGPGAAALVSALVEDGSANLARFDGISTVIGDAEVTVVRTFPFGNDYLLVTDKELAPVFWSTLRATVTSAGGAAVGELAVEAERIASGSPRFASELNEDYIPLEAGLRWAMSFNKGCYVGQEVIARMESHQRLAKRLVVLTMKDPRSAGPRDEVGGSSWPAAGADVQVDAVKVGRLTSVSAVVDERSIKALGYIKAALAKPGRQVDIVGESGAQVMRILSISSEA
jgi:folate-binding protein YgfZ